MLNSKMQEIKMVDLFGQYSKIKEEIDQAISKTIIDSSFIKGSEVQSFENNLSKYLNIKHVISCGNGTDALQLALMACDFEKEDEIITTDFTFIATIEAIALLGLKPILVDVNPDDFTISTEAIKKAITPRTKAIIPVHIFGQCANMESITAIAKENNLKIIEDVAQALGSDYYFSDKTTVLKSGTIGDIGCTSFFPSKNLGAFGDGGALYTNDDDLAKIIRSLANHGMEKRYYHDRIGINSRLDGIQAAILNVKLKYLDKYNEARRKAAAYYDSKFSEISSIHIPYRNAFSKHMFHQYTLLVKNGKRNALKEYLAKHNIPSMIYYPVPLHIQKAYSEFDFTSHKFNITNEISEQVLSLPMHTELSEEQLAFISDKIINFFS